MPGRARSPVERYHDRVAGVYDGIYAGDAYWEAAFAITWRNIVRHLPKDLSSRCLDVGCGSGRWGLRLIRAGYSVDFLDISQKMLDQVANRLAAMEKSFIRLDCFNTSSPTPPASSEPRISRIWHADMNDLCALPDASHDFIVGQGDPLNCAEKPGRTFKELARLLRSGGVLLLSVDNRLHGIDHFLEKGDVEGLEKFLRTGRTRWITDDPGERYPITMFTPGQIRGMCRERNLELLSLIGKTVLPLRRFKDILDDPAKRDALLRMEESLHGEEALFANASHLEFAVRKPG